MKLSDIKPNPNNPRIIRDERFAKLKNSIEQFPKMMRLRPIVVDAAGVILGGNMRLRALQDLGYKEIPDEWVKRADDLTEEENQRFIIAESGTTMVACEETGRKARVIELDPKYCAVIIDRMIKAFPDIEIKKNGEPYV